jgi:formate hydrogenlyase subunit 6/NADH:ubiquinone oxidoreductase subunit I
MLTNLRSILSTMRRRFKQAFEFHSWTVEYPHVVRSLPVMSHTTLKNNFLECTGCMDCQKICPVGAIDIQGFQYSSQMRRPLTSGGIPFEREVENFKIDYSKCIFCGICVEACAPKSLTFTKNFARPEDSAGMLKVDLIHVPRTMRRGQNMERSHES